jgi:hypothetical protein
MNGAAQSAFAGAYAWAVTVAPAAWARGAGAIAKVFALLALVTLLAGFAEPRFGERARRVALWGFVFACAIVWSAVPSSLGVLRVDALRGVAGVLGWALFGLTLAAPARSLVEVGVSRSRALSPRQVLVPGDKIYLWAGALVAAAIQAVGWSTPSAERALLVRFAVLAAGIAIVATSADLALARHLPRTEPSPRRRLDSATPMLVVLGLLLLVGALFAVRGW